MMHSYEPFDSPPLDDVPPPKSPFLRRPQLFIAILVFIFATLMLTLFLVKSSTNGSMKNTNECQCRNNGTCTSDDSHPCNCTQNYMGLNCTLKKVDFCQFLSISPYKANDARIAVFEDICYIMAGYSVREAQTNWSQAVQDCKPGLLFRPNSSQIMNRLYRGLRLPMDHFENLRTWAGLLKPLGETSWYFVDHSGNKDILTGSKVPWEDEEMISNNPEVEEYGLATFYPDDEMKPGGSIETMHNPNISLSYICQYNIMEYYYYG